MWKLVWVKRVVSIALTVTVLTSIPTLPRSALADARSTPELAGSSRIVGRGDVGMSVRVPQRASLPGTSFDNPSVSFETSSDVSAIVLIEKTSKADPFVLVTMRWHLCYDSSCRVRPTSLTYALNDPSGKPDPKRITLAEGAYWLYMVGGDGRSSVTLNLAGLDGNATLRPGHHGGASVSPLGSSAPTPPGTQFHHSHREKLLPGPGFAVIGTQVEHTAGTGGSGSCVYHEDESAGVPSRVAFGPQCAALADGWDVSTLTTEGSVVDENFTHFALPAGRWSAGYWHSWAGARAASKAAVLWVTLPSR